MKADKYHTSMSKIKFGKHKSSWSEALMELFDFLTKNARRYKSQLKKRQNQI